MKTTRFFAVIAIAAAMLSVTKVKAQSTTPPSKWRFGIGIEGAGATGNLNKYADVAVGGTARLQYGLTKHLALMLTSGYYNAFGKTIPYTDDAFKYQSLGIVPVKLGVKAYLGPKFYVSAEGGAGFEMKPNYYNQQKDTKIVFAPGLGYSLKHIDIGARYEGFLGQSNNYGMAALRIAYGFGL